jgi:acyl-CoA thioester hydrolase
MGEPFVTSQRLRLCDTDRLGHVNNAVYAVLYEAGRAEMLQLLDLLTNAFSPVIVRLEIDFLREMNWPADVRIETEVGRLGTKSFQLQQRLLVDGEVTSRAQSVMAIIDMQSRRAVPLTAAWRAALVRHRVAADPLS